MARRDYKEVHTARRARGTPRGTDFKRCLANELHYLLDLPMSRGSSGSSEPTKGRQIISAVFQAIKEALLRGETVQIHGFGRFWIFNVKPHRTGHNIIATLPGGGPALGFSKATQIHPGRKRVMFRPSTYLSALVNLPTKSLNYRERQAVRRMAVVQPPAGLQALKKLQKSSQEIPNEN